MGIRVIVDILSTARFMNDQHAACGAAVEIDGGGAAQRLRGAAVERIRRIRMGGQIEH